MALYSQLTAQASAYPWLLDVSLLHLPDPFMSKAGPADLALEPED